MLLGIAVQNGVVLISFFRQLRSEGRSVDETIRTGCALRFRPLSVSRRCAVSSDSCRCSTRRAPGADIQRPLAVVVMGGLVTSTVPGAHRAADDVRVARE